LPGVNKLNRKEKAETYVPGEKKEVWRREKKKGSKGNGEEEKKGDKFGMLKGKNEESRLLERRTIVHVPKLNREKKIGRENSRKKKEHGRE